MKHKQHKDSGAFDQIEDARTNQGSKATSAESERAASHKSEMFSACFADAALGLSITDLAGRFLEVNQAYCAITGYSEDELRGLELQAITHPDELSETMANVQTLISGEIPAFVMESRYVRKDGIVVWVENSVSLTRDSDGQPLNLVRISQDISARRRVEDELRSAKEFSEQLIETANAIILGLDTNGDIRLFNRAAEEITGYTMLELKGRNWFETLAPRDRYPQAWADFSRLFAGGMNHTFENPILTKSGTERYILWHNNTVIVDGNVIATISFGSDVTERRKMHDALRLAEEKYRNIFENAGEGIFQTTPEGRYISANPALARIHSFDSPDELIQSRTDITREIYVDPNRREEFKRLLEEHGTVRGFEHQIFRKDGTKIWISVNARAVRDERGALLFYEGTTQDINERKLAQARSAAFATLARKLSGARTQVAAGRIIAQTAADLFEWDSCHLDLYDADRDLIHPIVSVDTIDGRPTDVTPAISACKPTARSRRVIARGPELLLREEPVQFDEDAISFGDKARPSASIMTVPIRHAARIVGLLSVQSYKVHNYDDGALADLAALADHCGAALNRIWTEESLTESEERFHQVAEQCEDVIWITDQDIGRVLYINPAYEKVFGRTRASLYERLTSFLESVHPDDRAMVERMLSDQRNGHHRPCEYRVVHSDGSIRWMQRRTFPINNNEGEVYRVAGIGQDITERKNAEAALRESEELFSRAFHSSPGPLIITRLADGCFLNVNDAFLRAFGYERAEVIGETVRSLNIYIHPNDRKNLIDELQDRGALRGYESRARTKSGRILDLLVFVERVTLKGEQCLLSTAYDITDRKRVQEALRESEERYRELFENAKDAIYVHDLSGRYTSVNRAAEQLSGFPREEIIGKHYSNFMAPRHLKYARTNLVKKLDEVPETTYEVDLITKDRRRIPVEVNSRLIYEHGEAVGVQGTARDITERKRAEEARAQLALIVESSDDAIIGKTLDGTILSWNSGAENIYGYAAAEAIGRSVNIVVPLEQRDAVHRHLERIRKGESISHYETLGKRKDGKVINVSLTISPIKDAQDQIVGVSTIARDVTLSKQAEKELKTFSRRLIEAQEAERQSIARELHDEIGQILTAVRINLQSFQRAAGADQNSPRLDESIAVVDDALGRVSELSLELRPALLDDLGLETALHWYVDRYAQRTGILAEVLNGFEEGGRLPRELETACFRIAQEALTNIARHAQAGSVSVQLERFRERMLLTVMDDGIGFDVDVLRKNALAAAALGLRGMEERALAVGGQLEIDSGPGRGTIVRASFPLTKLK
jgi:PAS domain S-box-containing protein